MKGVPQAPRFAGDHTELPDLITQLAAPTRGDKEVVDFTFRIPPELHEEVRTMAAEMGTSANAVFAGLVDIGLKARGRRSISQLAPGYLEYLKRGRPRNR